MKKLFYIFISIVLFCSCNKDEVIKDNHRLSQLVHYYENTPDFKEIYKYNNGNLVKKIRYVMGQLDWEYKSETNYTYTGSQVIALETFFLNDDTLNLGKVIFTVNKGNVIKKELYTPQYFGFELDRKNEYLYDNNNNITNYKVHYYNHDGTVLSNTNQEFVYENHLLKETKTYSYKNSDSTLDNKSIYFYNKEAKIEKIENFNNAGQGNNIVELSSFLSYTYENENISEIKFYYSGINSLDYADCSFLYNKENVLTEFSISNIDNYEYTYENGEGNEKLFLTDLQQSNIGMPMLIY